MTSIPNYESEKVADDIYDLLVADTDFSLPTIDLNSDDFKIPNSDTPLYQNVDKLTTDQLTTGVVGGAGVFDALMNSIRNHLAKEFESQRITGREFADVYTGGIQQAMGAAVQFLLGKDQAYWQAIMTQANARTAEIQAVVARIQLEQAKLEYYAKKMDAQSAAADFALKKMQLGILNVEYEIKRIQKDNELLDGKTKKFNLDEILPKQRDALAAQIDQTLKQTVGIGFENQIKEYTKDNILPPQRDLAVAQAKGAVIENDSKQFSLDEILPKQAVLVTEQGEQIRAQTLNNRADGAIVAGLMGKQKELYDQQITSYKRDAEVKAAKMFVDTWVTQKTIDEGLSAPEALQNASVNTVLNKIKTVNSLS